VEKGIRKRRFFLWRWILVSQSRSVFPCIDSIIPTLIFCQADGGSRLLRIFYAHLPDSPLKFLILHVHAITLGLWDPNCGSRSYFEWAPNQFHESTYY